MLTTLQLALCLHPLPKATFLNAPAATCSTTSRMSYSRFKQTQVVDEGRSARARQTRSRRSAHGEPDEEEEEEEVISWAERNERKRAGTFYKDSDAKKQHKRWRR